jgi:hypothetical protein
MENEELPIEVRQCLLWRALTNPCISHAELETLADIGLLEIFYGCVNMGDKHYAFKGDFDSNACPNILAKHRYNVEPFVARKMDDECSKATEFKSRRRR